MPGLPGFWSCIISYIHADAELHFSMQITFGVAIKEARIARNARRILQYMLDNLMRGQASTVESAVR